MRNIFTVDVEDYFHPTEVQSRIGRDGWNRHPSRVEAATGAVLDLLAAAGARATFFVLGWVAWRFPSLVRKIAEAGHEIGCHSFSHLLVYDLSAEEFRRDTERAVRALEDACGRRPRVYRAPSFSITAKSSWAIEILVQCGFTHDSSIYPVVHDRYGIPGSRRHAHRIQTPSGEVIEVPVATARLSSWAVAPVGGGGYLRMLPYRYTAAGLRRINEVERQPACVYLHPWELDPDQPRLLGSGPRGWRTYYGLGGVPAKLRRLLHDFRFDTLTAVHPAAGASLGARG